MGVPLSLTIKVVCIQCLLLNRRENKNECQKIYVYNRINNIHSRIYNDILKEHKLKVKHKFTNMICVVWFECELKKELGGKMKINIVFIHLLLFWKKSTVFQQYNHEANSRTKIKFNTQGKHHLNKTKPFFAYSNEIGLKQ